MFDNAKPLYEKALKSSGFTENLIYTRPKTPTPAKKNRKRKIILTPHSANTSKLM